MVLNNIQKVNSKVKEGIGLVKSQGTITFCKEVSQYLFWELIGHRVVLPLAIKKLEENIRKINRLDETVDLAFTFNYFGLSIRPGQFRNEIIQLLKIVRELQPKNIMEIGTAKGGTLFLFSQTADPMARVISVDLPSGKFGGGYSNEKRIFYKSLAKPKQQIILIRKNAHEVSTLNEVKIALAGKALDFLFIDGDHTYEGVKKDFEMYSSLVRKGGAIAFHDIAKHPSNSQCEVNRFWNEIKNSYKFKEFVNDYNQGIYGIGLIYV